MATSVIATDQTNFAWSDLVDDLNRLLRLRTTPIGMKLFERREDMEAIPKIRRPTAIHTTDQIVGQAARNGWTVGITAEDLVGAQCSTVIGLHPRSDEWLSGQEHGRRVVFESRRVERAPARDGRGAVRTLRSDGREPAGRRAADASGHLSDLRDAGTDDPVYQWLTVDWLQEAELGLRRRIGLCGLLGTRARHGRTEPVHSVLRRTPLRRRNGRRAVDGIAAHVSAEGGRRARRAVA